MTTREDGGTTLEVEGFPPVALRLIGRHQVTNALAALAVAREYRLDADAVAAALGAYHAPKGRMELKHALGATLLVDCYNANPDSTRAALETLAAWPDSKRRIAVLGDMLELGDTAPALHRETGAAVRDAELWAIGAHIEDYAEGAKQAKVKTRTFEDMTSLSAALADARAPGGSVLIKATRGAALARALEGLNLEE
jgi:UDP-N-acetylmuramoyl-tripeptide--D-alanyl-D-alanine ligase